MNRLRRLISRIAYILRPGRPGPPVPRTGPDSAEVIDFCVIRQRRTGRAFTPRPTHGRRHRPTGSDS